MPTALYRITLRQAKKPYVALVRLVSEECPGSAVLCAQQWVIWSRAEGRGKRIKYSGYLVEAQTMDDTWSHVSEGTVADAQAAWTRDDERRIDAQDMVRPLIGQQGATTRGKARSLRGESRPKSRLAQLVQQMRQQK